MKKIKYVLMMIVSLFMIFSLSGCGILSSLIENGKIINNIENHYIEYSQNITVDDIEDALTTASEIAKSSTVGIRATPLSILDSTVSTGSGVVIKKIDNNDKTYTYYVVTNRHVVGTKSNTRIEVYLGNMFITASLIKYDQRHDLALISFTSGYMLNEATVSSDTLKTGQFAIAVGSPYDLKTYYNTVTVGSISSTSRMCETEGANGTTYTNEFIQHDASINSGNSGGGLYNINGHLIGINTWKLVGDSNDNFEGLNFAIPVTTVLSVFADYL